MTKQPSKARSQVARNLDETPGVASRDAIIVSPVQHTGRQGFLPMTTNTFDRCFISVVCLVAIHLLWMRFLEASLPLWIATLLSLIWGVIVVRRG